MKNPYQGTTTSSFILRPRITRFTRILHALSLVLHPAGHIQAKAMYEFERFERFVVKTITI